MIPGPASLLTCTEAAQRMGPKGMGRLKDCIREGRLRAFRFPDGEPGFNATEVEALLNPMSAEEALAAMDGGPQPDLADHLPATLAISAILKRMEKIAHRLSANPRWATASRIQDLYGVDRRRLTALVARGLVKRSKMGKSHQSQTLYCATDLDRHLEAVAAGQAEP